MKLVLLLQSYDQKNHKESILHILKPSYMSYKFNNINLQNLYEGGNVI